jgi:hypothetical protein
VPAGAVAATVAERLRARGSPCRSTPQSVAALEDGARDRVLYTALDNHFRQTEMLLIEVRNASERDSLDFERVSAEELLSDGRLYRMTAEHGGHPRLVQVLDDLEPLLVKLPVPHRISANDRRGSGRE